MRIMRFVKPDARKSPSRSFSIGAVALIAGLLITLLGACNLSAGGAETLPTVPANRTSIASGRPTINIVSPAPNSEVVLGSQVLVSVQAADTVGVSRVQLFVNDQVAKTVSSESAGGERALSAVLDFRPSAAGTVNVRVVAYRAATASDPASITITVRQAAQTTATAAPGGGNTGGNTGPVINPNDPTCRVLVNIGLNLRSGPGTEFAILTTLAAGLVVPVVGRTASNTWYQVRVNTTIGWVSGQYIAQYGNCSLIPVVSAPVAPTATLRPPTLTAIPPTNTLTLTSLPPTLTPTPGFPDLVITSINGPQTLALGAGNTPVTASFSVTITNTGSGPTAQFNNTVNVSPPSADTPLGVVGGLNPGESIVLNIAVPFNTTGVYTVTARADSDSIVTEVSEVNNSGTLSVTVTPGV